MSTLADGAWHRLHPVTPLLRGGLAFLAILSFVWINLRERLAEVFFPQIRCPEEICGDDPVFMLINGYLLLTIVSTLVGLAVTVGGFWLSWWMHSFRFTNEAIEVRSGILYRSHRKAPLDRIQGVSLQRPLLARFFRAARLEVNTAGSNQPVSLAYLEISNANALRMEIIRRTQGEPQPATLTQNLDVTQASASASDTVSDVLAPAGVITREQIGVNIPRLIGATLLSGTSLILLIGVVILVWFALTTDIGWVPIFTLFPWVIALGASLVNRFTRFMRYRVGSTNDGVQLGYGLLSLGEETLPKKRIHAVQLSQPLLWRGANWWTVRINLASQTTVPGSPRQGVRVTTLLPVGTREEALRVLSFALPELLSDSTQNDIVRGFTSKADDDFCTSPPRAVLFRPLSWRRNAFLLRHDALVLRKGSFWRTLIVVPTARMQSLSVQQGLLGRWFNLAKLRVHSVAGVINPRIGALDSEIALALFRDIATASNAAIASEKTGR